MIDRKPAWSSPTALIVAQVVLVVAAALLAFVSSATTYDYQHYGGQWRHILENGNPWTYARGDLRRFNAYGPLHALLAYPYALAPTLPKVVYALASVASSLGLVTLALRRPALRGRPRVAIVLFLALNPPLWILYVHGGFNDALVGALFLLGVAAYDRERFGLSATALGLGVLYKFTPIFVLPFLVLHRRRIEWRFALPLAGILVAGFGLAAWAWGADVLAPLQVGAGRPSSSASIFNFLEAKHSPLHLVGVDGVGFLSLPLLALSLVALFLAYVRHNLPLRQTVVLAFSTVLLLYRVNHLQFYLSLTLLLLYLVIEEYGQIRALAPALPRRIALFLGWLSIVVVAWKLGGRPWKQELHAVIGLPTFLVHLWMNLGLVTYLRRTHADKLLSGTRRSETRSVP